MACMETGLTGHHVTPTEGAKATPHMSWFTISKSLIPGNLMLGPFDKF